MTEEFEEDVYIITKNLSEQQHNQQQFNTRFLFKLMIFITFYRFYSSHIDTEGLVINKIEEILMDDLD